MTVKKMVYWLTSAICALALSGCMMFPFPPPHHMMGALQPMVQPDFNAQETDLASPTEHA